MLNLDAVNKAVSATADVAVNKAVDVAINELVGKSTKPFQSRYS